MELLWWWWNFVNGGDLVVNSSTLSNNVSMGANWCLWITHVKTGSATAGQHLTLSGTHRHLTGGALMLLH
jgi:hypothetical protein